MARHHDRGYVRLHRQILESDLWDEPATVLKAALAILLLAEWRPVGREGRASRGTCVQVPRGCLLLSRNYLARVTGLGRPAAQRAIGRLIAIGFIEPLEKAELYCVPRYNHFNPTRGSSAPAGPIESGSNSPDSIPGDELNRDQTVPIKGIKQSRLKGSNSPDSNDLSIYVVKKVKKVKKECVDTSTPRPESVTDGPDPDDPAPGTECNVDDKSHRPSPERLKLTHPPDKKPRVAKRHMDAVVQAYTSAVEYRLGFVPKLGDREYKHVRNLVLRHGPEHAVELAAGYPQLDDPWLHGKGFPLTQLLSHCNAVEVMLAGAGPRKKHDPTKVCTDPNSPGWDEDNF